jgi:hypothetical protein
LTRRKIERIRRIRWTLTLQLRRLRAPLLKLLALAKLKKEKVDENPYVDSI